EGVAGEAAAGEQAVEVAVGVDPALAVVVPGDVQLAVGTHRRPGREDGVGVGGGVDVDRGGEGAVDPEAQAGDGDVLAGAEVAGVGDVHRLDAGGGAGLPGGEVPVVQPGLVLHGEEVGERVAAVAAAGDDQPGEAAAVGGDPVGDEQVAVGVEGDTRVEAEAGPEPVVDVAS